MSKIIEYEVKNPGPNVPRIIEVPIRWQEIRGNAFNNGIEYMWEKEYFFSMTIEQAESNIKTILACLKNRKE